MKTKISTRKVFLSSTAKDLVEFRNAVYNAIIKLEGYTCVRMEDFTSKPSHPASYIQELIPSCDLFVGLIGLCYGSRPKGITKSYTELEYDRAREANIPCLMFLTSEEFSVPGKILHDDGRWRKQANFREKIDRDVIRTTFKSPEDLSLQVLASIRNWEQRDYVKLTQIEKIDCVILCGGYSTRLWPLTIDIPKVLLPVAGRPALAHILDQVLECTMIKETFISTNQKFATELREFLKEYLASTDITPIQILVDSPSTPEKKLGPIGALSLIISKIKPRDLLVIGGDNLFGFKVDDFLRFALSRGKSSNALFRFESYEEASEYGVVKLNYENNFLDFHEKHPFTTYRDISTACYFFRSPEIESIIKYLRSGGDPDSLGSFLHWLILQGSPITGFVFHSFWFDVGTREKLLQANWHYLIDSRRGSLEGDTIVKGPVQIETSSLIRDSRIGPYVYVGSETHITNSEVYNSLVMTGSIIRHSKIKDSVVGPNSVIEGDVIGMVCGPRTKVMTPRRD